MRHENFLESCLEIFFTLRPQAQPFDRDSVLDFSLPIEQLLDVLPGLFLITLQILWPSHGFKETGFFEALRLGPLAFSCAQQPGVAGEKMLEAEVYLYVTVFAPERI